MRQTNLVEFSELLQCGEDMGYDWNALHDILMNDSICPEYEIKTQEHGIPSVHETYESFRTTTGETWSEDTFKVMKQFGIENGVSDKMITVIAA